MENPLARALLKGEFSPGDTIKVDADAMSGTLVFTSDRSTVVAEASARRDARTATVNGDEPVGAGAGARGRGRKTVLDLPDVDGSKADRDRGELVN